MMLFICGKTAVRRVTTPLTLINVFKCTCLDIVNEWYHQFDLDLTVLLVLRSNNITTCMRVWVRAGMCMW